MTTIKIKIEELSSLVLDVLINIDIPLKDAEIVRDLLIFAELRKNNQGLIKLVTGALKPSSKYNNKQIEIEFETQVSAKINGNYHSGMAVVYEAVDIALKKASIMGISIVTASSYNSATGALGYWVRKIVEDNKIGIVCCNCPEMVAPHGSYEKIFGTNPIAIGIPNKNNENPVILDMATSAEAYYHLKIKEALGEDISNDIAYGPDGNPTTSPTEALKGALRVFDRSHKGSGLSLCIELLAGALSGASMEDKWNADNWGSLIIVIDPKIFGPVSDHFTDRVCTMCDRVKNAKPLPVSSPSESSSSSELFLPGERGDQVYKKTIESGVIELDNDIYKKLLEMKGSKNN